MEEEGVKPTTQSETIAGLVVLFYRNYLNHTPKAYTRAYGLSRALAKRYDEKDIVNRLEHLYRHTTIGYPMGLIETIAYRDLMQGKSLSHSYNYGFKRKPVVLGDLIQTLDDCLIEILDIFTELCIKYDIDPNLLSPEMFLTTTKTEGSL